MTLTGTSSAGTIRSPALLVDQPHWLQQWIQDLVKGVLEFFSKILLIQENKPISPRVPGSGSFCFFNCQICILSQYLHFSTYIYVQVHCKTSISMQIILVVFTTRWGEPRGIGWMGVPAPIQDCMGVRPCWETEQHSEHLLCSGQYASCVHTGGLSCLI